MENQDTKRKLTKKVITLIFILVIIIVLALYVYNRVNTRQTTDIDDAVSTQNVNSTNEENTVLVAETTETETNEPWEWQHDTLG